MRPPKPIKDAAELSDAIYAGEEELKKKAQSQGYDPNNITFIKDEKGGVKAAVLNNGKESTVVFRGTQGPEDTKTDMDFGKKNHYAGWQ